MDKEITKIKVGSLYGMELLPRAAEGSVYRLETEQSD